MPFQATEHFPLFLRKECFTELKEWRTFYAKQLDGNTTMREYLQNIDIAIAFEDALKECKEELSTTEDLVKNGLLESADALETIGTPFPWKSPSRGSVSLSKKEDSAATTTSDKLEGAVQTEERQSGTGEKTETAVSGHMEFTSETELPNVSLTTEGGDDE